MRNWKTLVLAPLRVAPRSARLHTFIVLGATSMVLLINAAQANAETHEATATANVQGVDSMNDEVKASTKSAMGDATDSVPASLTQLLSTSQYYSPYAFVVDKKARVLSVWQQTENGLKKVAAFPADLGKHEGNKQNRGDAKTPEGIYFLQTRLEGAGLDFKMYGKRAFTTDYPNYFDRHQGKTGSGIWLHAVPDHVALTRGSSGCVVVRNDVILNLTQYIRLGRTPILIQNKTEYEPVADWQKDNAEFNQWLESWRSAWEKKDLDSYIAKYGNDFESMKMNKQKWQEYKAHLNEEYHSITVHISKPSVFFANGNGIVRFLQEYTSDQHSDFGEKTLYLKKDAKGIRIVGETWAPESSQVARDEIESTTRATNADAGPKNGASSTGALKSPNSARSSADNG